MVHNVPVPCATSKSLKNVKDLTPNDPRVVPTKWGLDQGTGRYLTHVAGLSFCTTLKKSGQFPRKNLKKLQTYSTLLYVPGSSLRAFEGMYMFLRASRTYFKEETGLLDTG